MTVAFLGPEATFSHMAARHLFGLAARYREAATIDGVFDAVRRGEALCGVVPVESSTEGTISNTLDALVDGDLLIRQELVLEVSQCLLSRAPGLTSIERVYRQPAGARPVPPLAGDQPRQRAGRANHLDVGRGPRGPHRRTRRARSAAGSQPSSAASACSVSESRIAPRAPPVSSSSPSKTLHRTGADQTTLAFSLPDAGARGALRRVLEIFDGEGLNLSRIESRPKGTRPWEYVFLVDVEGHRQDPSVANVIEQAALARRNGEDPRQLPALHPALVSPPPPCYFSKREAYCRRLPRHRGRLLRRCAPITGDGWFDARFVIRSAGRRASHRYRLSSCSLERGSHLERRIARHGPSARRPMAAVSVPHRRRRTMHQHHLTLEMVDRDGAIAEAAEAVAGDSRADFLRKAGLVAGGGLLASGILGGFAGRAAAATRRPPGRRRPATSRSSSTR